MPLDVYEDFGTHEDARAIREFLGRAADEHGARVSRVREREYEEVRRVPRFEDSTVICSSGPKGVCGVVCAGVSCPRARRTRKEVAI